MKQPISLVLSGGAARGLAHIGVIEELEKQGFEIKSIAGASIGAFIAAMFAMGGLNEYKKWILTLDKVDVFKLVDFTFSSQGLIKGEKVFNKMRTFIDDKNIEDLKIPFAAVATDVANGEEVVFTKGSVYEALRASVAIPTVFTPVKKGDSLLIDGGVLNPIPLSIVTRTDGDLLVAVNLYANIPAEEEKIIKNKRSKIKSSYVKNIANFRLKRQETTTKNDSSKLRYFKLLDATTSAMVQQICKMSLELYKPDFCIDISKNASNLFDFYKAEELIEKGRRAARKSIEEYDKKMIEKQRIDI